MENTTYEFDRHSLTIDNHSQFIWLGYCGQKKICRIYQLEIPHLQFSVGLPQNRSLGTVFCTKNRPTIPAALRVFVYLHQVPRITSTFTVTLSLLLSLGVLWCIRDTVCVAVDNLMSAIRSQKPSHWCVISRVLVGMLVLRKAQGQKNLVRFSPGRMRLAFDLIFLWCVGRHSKAPLANSHRRTGGCTLRCLPSRTWTATGSSRACRGSTRPSAVARRLRHRRPPPVRKAKSGGWTRVT